MEEMDEAKKYQKLVADLLIKLRTEKGLSGIAFVCLVANFWREPQN